MARSTLIAAIAAVICLNGSVALAAQRLPAPRPVDDGAALAWVVKPDLMQISKIANDHGVLKGYAIVECTLTAGGRPKGCVVIEEEGGGFGRFVSELAGRYQAASKDRAGLPVQGRRVRLAFAMGAAKDL
eukprot:gene30454-30988_t